MRMIGWGVLQVSESLQFAESFVICCFRMNPAGSHELTAGDVVGLLKLARYPRVAQGCRKCYVDWPQASV